MTTIKTYRRALSNAQAAACENAKHPRCTCRCGGALHGKGHAVYQAVERDYLAQQKEINRDQVAALVKKASQPVQAALEI